MKGRNMIKLQRKRKDPSDISDDDSEEERNFKKAEEQNKDRNNHEDDQDDIQISDGKISTESFLVSIHFPSKNPKQKKKRMPATPVCTPACKRQ